VAKQGLLILLLGGKRLIMMVSRVVVGKVQSRREPRAQESCQNHDGWSPPPQVGAGRLMRARAGGWNAHLVVALG